MTPRMIDVNPAIHSPAIQTACARGTPKRMKINGPFEAATNDTNGS